MSTQAVDTAPAANPAPRSGITAYLCVSNAAEASKFYQRAFGGKELMHMPPDDKGRTMHIHLEINGASLMLADGFPEHGHPVEPHQGYTLHLQIQGDIEAAWKRAVDAGGEVMLPLQDMFWGDRYGQIRDPYGVRWSLGQPIKR